MVSATEQKSGHRHREISRDSEGVGVWDPPFGVFILGSGLSLHSRSHLREHLGKDSDDRC